MNGLVVNRLGHLGTTFTPCRGLAYWGRRTAYHWSLQAAGSWFSQFFVRISPRPHILVVCPWWRALVHRFWLPYWYIGNEVTFHRERLCRISLMASTWRCWGLSPVLAHSQKFHLHCDRNHSCGCLLSIGMYRLVTWLGRHSPKHTAWEGMLNDSEVALQDVSFAFQGLQLHLLLCKYLSLHIGYNYLERLLQWALDPKTCPSSAHPAHSSNDNITNNNSNKYSDGDCNDINKD